MLLINLNPNNTKSNRFNLKSISRIKKNTYNNNSISENVLSEEELKAYNTLLSSLKLSLGTGLTGVTIASIINILQKAAVAFLFL